MTALTVEGLRVATKTGTPLVHGIDFSLAAGRSLGVVGESGSGKTLTAMAVAGLLPAGVETTAGDIHVAGFETAGRRERLRDAFGVVFQNPTVSLNPRLTIRRQLREALPREQRTDARAVELLQRVGVPRAAERLNAFPHELSGGLNQRIVIAIAIARSPKILIADEATTALDVSVQKQVLDLIDDLRRDLNLGVLLVSHDIGVIADRSDEVLVLNEGRVVEAGRTEEVLRAPSHPYTQALLDAVPRLDATAPVREVGAPLIAVRGVTRDFGPLRAVDAVDLTLHAGQSLGIVGESGSGKTTLARIIVGLDRHHTGQLEVSGERPQYVFQDPYSALDPRQTVFQIIAEPIELSGTDAQNAVKREKVAELLDAVRLPQSFATRKPRQLSGGQRQRVVIARALALDPTVLVADEPVSALDLSVQAAILDLLATLRAERDLSYLVISHDLAVIKQLCTDVAVMRDGAIVEHGPADLVFADPQHAYTRQLLDAIPNRKAVAS
ncbi:ABC transporter ATP-binding protein [Solirubrobacter taibaiensis]|nr:ABC transporter ATP-binding protein [Solirubrobacter taibaiensis]